MILGGLLVLTVWGLVCAAIPLVTKGWRDLRWRVRPAWWYAAYAAWSVYVLQTTPSSWLDDTGGWLEVSRWVLVLLPVLGVLAGSSALHEWLLSLAERPTSAGVDGSPVRGVLLAPLGPIAMLGVTWLILSPESSRLAVMLIGMLSLLLGRIAQDWQIRTCQRLKSERAQRPQTRQYSAEFATTGSTLLLWLLPLGGEVRRWATLGGSVGSLVELAPWLALLLAWLAWLPVGQRWLWPVVYRVPVPWGTLLLLGSLGSGGALRWPVALWLISTAVAQHGVRLSLTASLSDTRRGLVATSHSLISWAILLAVVGLPPFPGFAATVLVLRESWLAGQWLLALSLLALWTRLLWEVFGSQPNAETPPADSAPTDADLSNTDTGWLRLAGWISPAILVGLQLWWGLAPPSEWLERLRLALAV